MSFHQLNSDDSRSSSAAPSSDPLGFDKRQKSPIPVTRTLILCAINFTESLSYSQIIPYTPSLVQHLLGDVGDQDPRVGAYSGLLIGIFSIAQFVTSHAWGYASDIYGRRPILLLGMFVNIVTIPLFGFSLNLTMAFAFRALAGLMNGNFGVVRSYAREMLDPSNELRGFAYITLAWILGFILGPLLGGNTYGLGEAQFMKDFPMALPCLLTITFVVIAFFVAIPKLDETYDPSNPTKRGTSEDVPLPHTGYREDGTFLSISDEGEPLVVMDDDDALAVPESRSPSEDSGPQIVEHLLKNTDFWVGNFLLLFTSAVSVSFWTLFPLWAKVKIENDGWGFSEGLIGWVQASGGLGEIVMALIMYAPLTECCGILWNYRITWIFPLIIFAIWQEMAALTNLTHQIVVMVVVQLFVSASFQAIFTSCFILINNSVYREVLGTANGISQALSNLFRGVGPILFGWLFGIFVNRDLSSGHGNSAMDYFLSRYFPFYILAILVALNILLSFFIPSSYNRPKPPSLLLAEKPYSGNVQEL